MLNVVIIGLNLIVGAILIVGLLLMSLNKSSPCAIIHFGSVTLGLFLMLRMIWLGLITDFQLLLLFVILFWLLIAWILMVVDFLICGNEL